ncbi:hypothetical protein [Campylobacter sp. CCS1377]|uniref:Replication protein n=1 Tax=Campylobacter sp. CCS1377 TaxID=3158229 RepID=A0AAU7E6G4_9BACT
MLPNFKADFDVANYTKKRLRERRGYLKLSNTIVYGGLSVDALALYIQLAKLSEKTIISEIYLREFIKVKDDKRISLNRLRTAKRELTQLNLLEINKKRNGSLNFYEWILKDEKGEIKRHFNKALTLLKNSDENLSKALKNNALSIDRKLTTDEIKNQNSLYKDTHTHTRDNKFINNNINNNKFINLNNKNLENKEEQKEKKENCVSSKTPSFIVDFNKLDEKDLKTMAKKTFKEPSANDLMAQIKAFNQKHGTDFTESLANDFIEYWSAREWKRNGKRMDSVAGSLYTWMKNAKEWQKPKNEKTNKNQDYLYALYGEEAVNKLKKSNHVEEKFIDVEVFN